MMTEVIPEPFVNVNGSNSLSVRRSGKKKIFKKQMRRDEEITSANSDTPTVKNNET